ncbi:MAG: flagellar biosynthetic protein FliR [Desulfovibrionaceae bacterium]
MDLFHYDPAQFMSFLLTLFRISIVLFMLPFFGGQNVPATVRAALLLVLTVCLWPALSFPATLMPGNLWDVAIMFAGELILGLVMGMMVNFLFAAVQTGGQLIGFMMGLSMVNVMDPLTGISEAVTSHFLYMVTMLVFFALGGPYFLLSALAQSFELVPPGGILLNADVTHTILDFSGQIFILAVKIAAPIIAAIFLVDLALALVSRAAPQMNVLMLGFPVKISVGFFFMFFIFNTLAALVGGFLDHLGPLFHNVLQMMQPL